MNALSGNHAFTAYAITTILLCLNMLGLWGYSAVVRGKTKTVVNPEDTTTVAKGATVVESDPEAVARVLRAHTNAMANIVPFVLLGAIYVPLGASSTMAHVCFGLFTLFRYGHTVAYLNEKQPWRTLFFALGGLMTLVMIGDMVRLMLS